MSQADVLYFPSFNVRLPIRGKNYHSCVEVTTELIRGRTIKRWLMNLKWTAVVSSWYKHTSFVRHSEIRFDHRPPNFMEIQRGWNTYKFLHKRKHSPFQTDRPWIDDGIRLHKFTSKSNLRGVIELVMRFVSSQKLFIRIIYVFERSNIDSRVWKL